MNKNVAARFLVVFGLALILVGCGEKSQESVISKLDEKLSSMDGYKAKAEMKMSTGESDQKYNIDVWYQKKDYYRVSLGSDQDKKGNQVILKNDDGVFVLTPALNKSFKFQTDWPENSSQPYLYQSLVDDVKKDKAATFTVTDQHYIFRTKTNYQSNNNLPYQEIFFNKKNFTPELVKVLDKDEMPLVEVKFSSFEMDPSFKAGDFKMEDNMTSVVDDVPVSGDVVVEPFTVVFPLDTMGAELKDKKEVTLENGVRIIMNYTGEKNFTLVQEKMDIQPTFSYPREVTGDIVNLGYTIGASSGNAIEWSHNGVDFYLASEGLTKEELIDVAKSVQGKEVK